MNKYMYIFAYKLYCKAPSPAATVFRDLLRNAKGSEGKRDTTG